MFRKKDDAHSTNDSAAPEETAYEDNWYRSLKALAEQRDDDPTPLQADPPVTAAVEAPAPVEAPGEAPVEPPVEPTVEPRAAEGQPVDVPGEPGGEPEEFETRAGRLLERLRTLQSLGDTERASEPEEPSGHS